MKIIKENYKNIDFNDWDIEENNGFIPGDVVEQCGRNVTYYNGTRGWTTISLLNRHLIVKYVNDNINNFNIDVIKLDGHWPWFKSDGFRLVKKSFL